MFCYKIFDQGEQHLLAISDSAIIGKTFEENDLNIHVSEEFYSGNECDEKEAKELAEKATIVNAVGKDIIALLVKEGVVDDKMILNIQGVPHAQVISIE